MLIHTIHVVPNASLAEISPTRRLLVLHWLLALKDRATSIRHSHQAGRSKLAYEVEGQWLDLEPLPDFLGPLIGREVRDWLNPSRLRRSLADGFRFMAGRLDPEYVMALSYPFLLIVDPFWSIWGVTIQESRDRWCVTFELLDCTNWGYDQAEQILNSLSPMEVIDDKEFAKWYPGL